MQPTHKAASEYTLDQKMTLGPVRGHNTERSYHMCSLKTEKTAKMIVKGVPEYITE